MAGLAGHTLAGRYEVIDRLGVGGMGEVYRARDRELDELVALKVVRQDLLAGHEALERFRREVKLARRVTHHNVARAFELVVTDELVFYTMELIDGVPLTQRLANRLPVTEAATIAIAMCDALAAAHAAGIVHRDVKPGNILLGADGRIVLTDFGIAAWSSQELGELEGTPRFMAPEQARGEPPTPAADIYALGVVLFEMLAGAPAFTGSVAEILDAKSQLEHLEIATVNPELDELVARATNRDPALRPHSAQAFRHALEPFAAGPRDRSSETSLRRAPPLPTVIVRAPLPSDVPEYLVELARQLFLDRLVQWPRLRVVPREPGELLGTTVEIAADDDELRLTARSSTTSLVLGLPFDIERLATTTENAARVIAAFAGSAAAVPPIRSRPPPPEALVLIARARYEVRRDRSTLDTAVELCERARAVAPDDARVLATLATCQAQLAFYAVDAPPSLLEDATRNALDAIALDPALAEAHFARAHVELHAGRPVVAAVCFRAAIAHAPMMAEAHEWLGRLLLEAGFRIDAMARLEDAFALGPLAALRWDLAIRDALVGKWNEVDRTLAALDHVGPDRGLGYRIRIASWRDDRVAERAALAELGAIGTSSTFERETVMKIYSSPWPDVRDAILARASATGFASARRRAFLAQLGAEAAGRAGDVETCLTLLLRANAEGLFDLPWLDGCPLLTTARAQPRFRVIRNDVAARADAIHDALYSEHRDLATVATIA